MEYPKNVKKVLFKENYEQRAALSNGNSFLLHRDTSDLGSVRLPNHHVAEICNSEFLCATTNAYSFGLCGLCDS